jgi:hypothetical protein
MQNIHPPAKNLGRNPARISGKNGLTRSLIVTEYP